jgi:hypothetical protein
MCPLPSPKRLAQVPQHRAEKWVPVFRENDCGNKILERQHDSEIALPL